MLGRRGLALCVVGDRSWACAGDSMAACLPFVYGSPWGGVGPLSVPLMEPHELIYEFIHNILGANSLNNPGASERQSRMMSKNSVL